MATDTADDRAPDEGTRLINNSLMHCSYYLLGGVDQFVFDGKFHRHVGGIFLTFSIIFQLSRWNFTYSFLCYHYFSVEKLGKMLVDLLKMSEILVDFLSFFEKSVEFFAANTDWNEM